MPAEAVAPLAQGLNLSRAEVHGVLTFYHDFRTRPPGRHVLRLCRAESCQAMGAEALAEHARARLGERIAPGVVYTTFHFPQTRANGVTPENSDWATSCPEYKVTAVQVVKVTQAEAWRTRTAQERIEARAGTGAPVGGPAHA